MGDYPTEGPYTKIAIGKVDGCVLDEGGFLHVGVKMIMEKLVMHL